MSNFINRFWYQSRFLPYFLKPLEAVYRCAIWLRHKAYQLSIFKSHRISAPIIVVGNISVGGTGKSPVVSALAKWACAQGYNVGIASRGYGGKSGNQPLDVFSDSLPAQVGDEPLMLAKQTQVPIVVCRQRVKAAQRLVQKYQCDLIISDDGLQHYAMHRDIEIAIIDGKRLMGNGMCLPAGPLREPPKRLNEVDFILYNTIAPPDGYNFRYDVLGIFQLSSAMPIDKKVLEGKTIHAVAGIANPNGFFELLDQLGLQFIQHPFPDHHAFKKDDFGFMSANDLIIMTEKDAVKCRWFDLKNKILYLKVQAKLPEGFLKALEIKIKGLKYEK